MSLQSAEGDPRHLAVECVRQINRRTTHAATDIEDCVATLDVGRSGECFGQLQLGAGRRLRRVPQTVMNMPPPQQTIKQRRQVVVIADDGFANAGAVDHVGKFQQGKDADIARRSCPRIYSIAIVSHRAVSINSERENTWAGCETCLAKTG